MAQDDESKSPFSGIFGPALVLTVLSAVGYLSYQPPLKSDRPRLGSTKLVPLPPSPRALKPVHARLWDDPVAVAYKDSQRRQKTSVPPPAGLAAAMLSARDAAELHRELSTVVEQLTAVREGSHPQSEKRFLVMPVLVPGGPFADDTERRKRITYAILSALGASGFHLEFADRLSYVEVPICVFDRATASDLSTTLAVPIKLFVPDDNPSPDAGGDAAPQPYSGVIVCWINQAQLGSRPLSVLHQVLKKMFGGISRQTRKKQLDLRIVGPSDSDMLLDIAWEDREISSAPQPAPAAARAAAALRPTLDALWSILSAWACAGQSPGGGDCLCKSFPPLARDQFAKGFHDPLLISPMATVPDREFPAHEAVWRKGGRSNSGLTVVRAIGTDDVLALAMKEELIRRDAWPRTASDGKSVVLVTENDTDYGRSIARAFDHAMDKAVRERRSRDDNPLQVFKYIQGIDGKLDDPKDDDQGRQGDKPDPSQADLLHTPAPEALPASGRSQYDYLRRLQDHLRALHEEQRSAGKPGITAIGVVGTNVYDKLLVLRALRKQFPRAWFFTTDLDAELYRGDEYATTRNLLIASHFGLELNRDLQRSAPPFRDSYQTAVFLATLYCVDDKPARSALHGAADTNFWRSASGVDQALKPLVFELGRSGPYQLTMTGSAPCLGAKVHPASPRESEWFSWGRALALVAITMAALGLVVVHNSWLRAILWNGSAWAFLARAACAGGLLVAIALAVEWANRQPDGEPFLVFEGISLWTPILIRLLAAIVGVVLLRSAFRKLDLRGSIDEIADWLLHAESAVSDREAPASPSFRLPDWWRTIAGFGSCLVNAARGRKPPSPFAVWHRSLGDRQTATALVHAYREQGAGWRRTTRAVAIAIALVIFAGALFQLTDQPLQPYRGTICRVLSNVAVVAAVVMLALLTGFIVDALWLCRLLIRQLADADADWPAAAVKPPDPRVQVLSVRFIAWLTHSVGRLTWYPLIVVFLMILARSKVFDLIDFSWPLILLWLVIGAGVIFVTWNLRHTAVEARETILGRLRDEELGMRQAAPTSGTNALLRGVIDEIEREGSGRFRPFTQDPLFNALVVFFGGSGGVLLLDQLIPYL